MLHPTFPFITVLLNDRPMAPRCAILQEPRYSSAPMNVSDERSLLLAYSLSFGLYGVFITQVYAYYICFPKDRQHVKILVYSVLAIETCQAGVLIRDAVVAFGAGFGKLERYLLLSSSSVGCIVQCFYAYRIKVLTRRNAASCVIVVLALVQFIGAIVAGIEGRMVGSIIKLSTRLEYTAQVVRNVSSAICDIIISAYICYYLSTSPTKLENTQKTLTRIIKLIVGSGMFTAMVAILDLALYLAKYNEGAYFLVPCICLGKLYSNSMMVVLNNRAHIIGGRGLSFTIGGHDSMDTSTTSRGTGSYVEARGQPLGQK
ncbi:hypothetical protein BDQ17DRAFT_1344953 [Cyathus striatus]|nr:hypothetical protein BDQ17DRAFT_1344953 [Cyathus striatus]